jgi:hypothetical protein
MAFMTDAPAQEVPISGGATARRGTEWKLLIALISSDILALIAGGMWMDKFFPSDAEFRLFLGFVWLLGVAGIVFSEFKLGRAVKHRILFGVGAAAALGLFLCWFNWWVDKILDRAIK